jgi:hypothetical protein
MKMNPGKGDTLLKEYALDGGLVQVYQDFMVCMLDEGSTLNLEFIAPLVGISEVHFRDRPFGYISYRKNSHAVDPTIYSYLRELSNLRAVAVVSRKDIDMHNFDIERLFYKRQIEFFIEYENATEWVKSRIRRLSTIGSARRPAE